MEWDERRRFKLARFFRSRFGAGLNAMPSKMTWVHTVAAAGVKYLSTSFATMTP
jgi:hypothetical protein